MDAGSLKQGALFFQCPEWVRGVVSQEGSSLFLLAHECGVYPNGEAWVRLQPPAFPLEKSRVFARFTDEHPLDRQLMWLANLVQTVKRHSLSVELVLPYLPYSLQEREVYPGDAIASAAVIALLESQGVGAVTLSDPHSRNNVGMWSVPVAVRSALRPLADAVLSFADREGLAVIAPDKSAVALATPFADFLGAPVYVLHKERQGAGQVTVSAADQDLSAVRHAIFVDDLINTGGTLVESVKALQTVGRPEQITVVATHGLFAKDAFARFLQVGITTTVVTDSFWSHVHREQPASVKIVPLF